MSEHDACMPLNFVSDGSGSAGMVNRLVACRKKNTAESIVGKRMCEERPRNGIAATSEENDNFPVDHVPDASTGTECRRLGYV